MILNLTPYRYGPYLTFQSPNGFSLRCGTPAWDGTLEYSLDKETWTVWDGSRIVTGRALYLRGTGNTQISGENSSFVIDGSGVACIGNIETLLDYGTVVNGEHPAMAASCFSWLFYGCTALTAAPALPAMTLAEYCYYRMFWNCTALTAAPELPARTLASNCYEGMFELCTGLTAAPALPAVTLASSCYKAMFWNCTGLTAAPALPAMTLAEYCYFRMFCGCTGLTAAPALPAMTLAEYCYYRMFQGCTALTTIPKLFAITLERNCYSSMFLSCKKLKLSAAQAGEYSTPYRIPSSGTGTTASNALLDMFEETGGTFTETPEINTTYYLSTSNSVV